MDWYHLSSCEDESLTKTAGTFAQEEWGKLIGDYQRWVIDTYDIKIYLTKSSKFCSISLNVWNWHTGNLMFQDFWKYDPNKYDEALASYKKMVKAAERIERDFTTGDNFEAPSGVIVTTLRNELWELDRENLAKSNIPSINYSRQKATYVKDWRNSLYGNRYPTGDSTGF